MNKQSSAPSWPRWDLTQPGARTERSQVAQREAETAAMLEKMHQRLLLLEDSMSTRQHSAEQRISELQDRLGLLEDRVAVQKGNEKGIAKEAKQVKSEVSVKLDEMHFLLEELKRRGKVPFPGSSLERESTSGSLTSYDAPVHRDHLTSGPRAAPDPTPRYSSRDGASPGYSSRDGPTSPGRPQHEHRMVDEAIGKVDATPLKAEAPALSLGSSKDMSRPERYLRKVVDQLEEAMIKRHTELEHKMGKRVQHLEKEVHEITEASHPKFMSKLTHVVKTHHKGEKLHRGETEREDSRDTTTDI